MSAVEDSRRPSLPLSTRSGRGCKQTPHPSPVSLTDVASSTGISKSTLSRLETGQRRPTLELLLALSHAYRVPLDALSAHPRKATRGCG